MPLAPCSFLFSPLKVYANSFRGELGYCSIFRAAEYVLCLDRGQLCLCVSVWLELKGRGRGAVVLGLERP